MSLQATLNSKRRDDLRKYAKALGIYVSDNRKQKKIGVLKTEIIRKVEEVGNLLFSAWMSRADVG